MKSNKLINNVTIGSDPEMFLWSETKNKFVPVCGLVGGTKEEPLFITDKGHALQEDNVMVEFCIPPCKTAEEFAENIEFVKNYINDTVLAPLGYVTKSIASARFDINDLQSDQAQLFGCSESYNAWTGDINSVSRADATLRTAGGHIHIGYDNPNHQDSVRLIKAMDLFLAVPSIILDKDTERRKMYGKAGEYRFKKYGVEHRTLSTFWTDTPELCKWAFDQAMKAIDFVNSFGIITDEDRIVRCINNADQSLAREIMDDYNMTPVTVDESISYK